MQFIQQRLGLLNSAVLQDALYHPAPIRMRRQREHLTVERVHDVLQCHRVHTFDALLHDMVAVLILHTLEDVSVQLLDHFNLDKEQVFNHYVPVKIIGPGMEPWGTVSINSVPDIPQQSTTRVVQCQLIHLDVTLATVNEIICLIRKVSSDLAG